MVAAAVVVALIVAAVAADSTVAATNTSLHHPRASFSSVYLVCANARPERQG